MLPRARELAAEDVSVALSRRGRLFQSVYLGFVRRRVKAALGALPASLRRLVASGYTILAAII